MKPNPEFVTGVAWYREEQWPLLLALSIDRDKLAKTYAEWQQDAERTMLRMRIEGLKIQKVDVDVAELQAWCIAKGRPINGAARAEFVVEKLQRGE